jgi:hypothetical protein
MRGLRQSPCLSTPSGLRDQRSSGPLYFCCSTWTAMTPRVRQIEHRFAEVPARSITPVCTGGVHRIKVRMAPQNPPQWSDQSVKCRAADWGDGGTLWHRGSGGRPLSSGSARRGVRRDTHRLLSVASSLAHLCQLGLRDRHEFIRSRVYYVIQVRSRLHSVRWAHDAW